MSDKVVGLEPVMSMFATEVECLRARDKWNEAQVAALQAELAEANDSLTIAYMAGAASKLDEIRGLQAELAECKRDACALWVMLDDIDTGGDIAKADDVLYRAIAERSHKRRFEPQFEWVISAIDAPTN